VLVGIELAAHQPVKSGADLFGREGLKQELARALAQTAKDDIGVVPGTDRHHGNRGGDRAQVINEGDRRIPARSDIKETEIGLFRRDRLGQAPTRRVGFKVREGRTGCQLGKNLGQTKEKAPVRTDDEMLPSPR